MDASELLQKYANGHRRFVLVNLRGAKLAGANLAGANFNRTNFTEANLVRAKLGEVSLVRANLTRADLRGADLAGVNLRNANLTGANIDLADLPPETYAGAILPDGSRQPLELSLAPGEPLVQATGTVVEQPGHGHEWPFEGYGAAAATPAAWEAALRPAALGVASLLESPREDPESALVSLPLEPEPDRSPGIPMDQFSWRRLPWLLLSFWSMGYGFLGLFLFLYAGPLIAWPLVWCSSLLWLGDGALLWFAPVAAAVAVVLGSGISTGAMWVGGLVSLGLAAGLQATGWAWRRALLGGLWLGGIGCILVAIAPLMVVRSQAAGLGGSSTLPLGLMVAIGVGLIALGTRARQQLQRLGQQRREEALILGAGAGAGLLVSCLVGWWAIAGLA